MYETENLRLAHDALLVRIKECIPELETLLKEMDEAEDEGVYYYYHSDPRVYGLQHFTKRACALFRQIASHDEGNLTLLFEIVVKEGTNRKVDLIAQSRVWIQDAGPVISAFYHARYFLNQHIKFARELEQSPDTLQPGWAALLCLYGLR
jgi:hypothetical protein